MANSTADGSVIIDVNMDVSDAEKELSKLKGRVFKLEDDIGQKESRRNELVQRRKALEAEINELKRNRKTLDGDAFADTSKTDEKILSMREEVSKINKEIGSTDTSLDSLNSQLDYTKMRFGEVSEIAKNLKKEFDTSTISGRLEEASYELAKLSAQGKGLGDKEYDEAYRKLALLTQEARNYQKELAKTPEQAQKESEIAQKRAAADALAAERARQAEEKRQEQIAKEASAAIEAQIAEQRLIDLKENSVVADQHIVDLNEELYKLKAKQTELQRAGVGAGYEEYDHISQRLSEINRELKGYQDGLIRVREETEEAAKETDSVDGAMKKLTNRIIGLAKRVFFFSMITKGLRSVRDMLSKYINTNDEARQAIANLKGALLTLAQPLVEVVIPAFITFVNVLTKIVAAAAQFVSLLFGKTLKQSKDGAKNLYKEAGAIGAVGSAAEDAAGSLAGFDEINTISTEDAGGGGGGGGGLEEIAPDFGDWEIGEDLLDRLKEVSDLVGLIAAGLALWKISGMLPGMLGTIAEKLAGMLLTVGGLLLYWHGLTDAWENGVDWLNLIEMIGGLAAAALGLYLLFGPIAAGIALVVGGLGMLITGFHDAMENGWNLQNLLLSIAGILAAGLGIAIITGSWLPLLIAGIASVLLALTVATGHGEELIEGIQDIIEGFKDFFTGIFAGDIEKAIGGIEKIFSGLKKSVFAVINGLKDGLLSFLNWLDEKTGGRFHGIIESAKSFVTEFFLNAKETAKNFIDSAKQIFLGITQFLSGIFTQDWDLAWEGVKNIFKGAWNGIVSSLEGAINLIIRGLNFLIRQMNKIRFDVPDWVPGVGGKSIGINIPSIPEARIPRLAQGAVIPPNREFMAVLGDQSSGYNIEAPEDLIRKIIQEELGRGNAELVQLLQAILSAVKDGHIIMVDGSVFGRTAIKTINGVTASAGRQLLLV